MQTSVDRVISGLTLKHPMSDAQSAAVRDDAIQFAARLLENYKDELSRRHLPDPSPRENTPPRL